MNTPPTHLIFVLVVAIIAIGGVIVLWGSQRPHVRLTAIGRIGEGLRFAVVGNRRVNSLWRISVWRKGSEEYLWQVDLVTGRKLDLPFGAVLAGSSQLHPPEGTRPEELVAGETIMVAIKYQYDQRFPPAPSAGTEIFEVRIGNDGEVEQTSKSEAGEYWYPKTVRRRRMSE